jgi:4Fe-4S ferredoxin
MTTPAECKHEAGLFAPVIDRSRCEGKEDCVRVCPYEVFEMGKLTPELKSALSFTARLKAALHRNRQSFAIREQNCHACGLCVAACPERAITLARVASPA